MRTIAAMICLAFLGMGPAVDAGAAENVAGITIDHVTGFKLNKTFSKQAAERLRQSNIPFVAVEAYEASVPWADKRVSGTIYVVRTRYKKGFARSLNDIVQETFDDVVAKYENKAWVRQSQRIRTGGLETHRMSFSLEVDEVTVGSEILVLPNKAQDSIWIVQAVYDESSEGLKGTPDKEARRSKAVQIVESARVSAAAKSPQTK